MASDVHPVADLRVAALQGLLDDMDRAVIVQDASGRIQLLNVAAQLLFPGLGLGEDFERGGESFVAESGGRRVRGRLRRLAEGWQAWVVSEVPDDQVTDDARDRQDFLLAAGRALVGGAVGHDAAMAALVRLAVPVVGEQAAVLVPASRARVSWWCCTDGVGEPVQGIARAPALRAAPVLAGALRGAVEYPTTVPANELAVLAAVFGPDIAERDPVVVTPLHGRQRVEGLLVVVRPVAAEWLAPLAELAGPALEAARRRRDRVTALTQLQAPLLPLPPEALPDLPGVQLGVAHRPAAGELAVGGDFYLIRPTPDGGALLALGDVCGKGAEALAESGRVQHSMAALMILEQEPARLLYLLNQALLAAGRIVFTTLVLGALQPADRGFRLTLAAGGHPAPMVLRGNGHVEEVGVPGTVVGILPDARFGRTTIMLAPGETCLFYSDGVTEAGRGTGDDQEQFGSGRLAACLRDCGGMTAQAVATRVERAVTDWLGRNDGDDLAVLAVRVIDPGK
jgi:sigma-B regulation protein RsbU (phosphoserine phosphatase)